MQTDVIVALIISGLALLGVIFNSIVSAKKNDLDILRGIIDELRKRIDELECENRDLADWAERLVNQVKGLGKTPVRYIRNCKDEDAK